MASGPFPVQSAENQKNWPTPDEYWVEIRKIAREAYTGMDVELILDTGYTHYLDKGIEYPGNSVSMGVSVPLYSKKEKMKRREDVIKFQQKGAELIQKLETAIAQVIIFEAAVKTFQNRVNDEGVEIVNAYFDQVAKVAEQKARVTQYHREIQSLINPFSGKAKIINDLSAVKTVSQAE